MCFYCIFGRQGVFFSDDLPRIFDPVGIRKNLGKKTYQCGRGYAFDKDPKLQKNDQIKPISTARIHPAGINNYNCV